MPRTERHVVPNEGGGWDILAPGASQASAHLERQDQAVQRARQILRNEGGGELVVHDRQGKVREKNTVRPARDPHPPTG
jgi:Uncharacterized protein conserved in bacteria (DUF2188)